MASGRVSDDVGETLDAIVMGLADLDADQLRLQWRNHLGGTAPAHLPRWLLLRVLAYRLQAATLGDLNKATARSIHASQGGAIEFGSPSRRAARGCGTELVSIQARCSFASGKANWKR
jgi:hypothetical protein